MYDKFNGGGGGMNYVEQFYSTNIKLRAFEDALAETGFNTDIRHIIPSLGKIRPEFCFNIM